MKRLLASGLVIALVLSLAGCGGSGSTSSGGTSGGGTTSSGSGGNSNAIATVDQFKAAIDKQFSGAEWYPDLKGIAMENYLGADVLVLRVSWGSADADWEASNRKQQALNTDVGGLNQEAVANIALVDADGTVWHVASTSGPGPVPMNDAFDLPPAPTTAGEFKAWLDTVYGSGSMVKLGAGDTWYGAIDSVAIEDLGYGNGPHLVIRTSIGNTDKTQQSLLQFAMATTGSPLLSEVSLFYADGGTSAYGGGASKPGQTGWYYPAAK